MKLLRRTATALLAVLLIAACSSAQAQAPAYKQLPGTPIAVIKVNNLQGLNDKFVAVVTQMGLKQFHPALGDPLGFLKQQAGIKEGLDTKGDLLVGIYEPAGGGEPPFVLLVPVTDFKAFVGNFQNAKTEGDITTFNFPNETEPVYSASKGKFAALSPQKALLTQAPGNLDITGAPLKQLDSSDVAAYLNVKPLSAQGLPALRQMRPDVLRSMEESLKREGPFAQKMLPALKALVSQLFNVAEGAMESGKAAGLGINLSTQGIGFNLLADFEPTSYFGKALADLKNTDDSLLAGLPNRKYFVFGGAVIDPVVVTRLVDDFFSPISKELTGAGPDGKPFLAIIDAMRAEIAASSSSVMGLAMPTGAPGKESLLQQVTVARGDAKKIAAVQRQYLQATVDLLKLIPGAGGDVVSLAVKPDARTIDGVAMDQISVNMKFDQTTPEGAQAAQALSIFYGPGGLKGYMGAANDNSFVSVLNGSDDLLNATVAAAKSQDKSLAQSEAVKAVSSQLPAKRLCAYYVCVDNIITTALQYMAQFGFPIQAKLEPDLPPIGMTLSTEGAALRADVFISNKLIENLVAFGLQIKMQMEKGAKPGGI